MWNLITLLSGFGLFLSPESFFCSRLGRKFFQWKLSVNSRSSMCRTPSSRRLDSWPPFFPLEPSASQVLRIIQWLMEFSPRGLAHTPSAFIHTCFVFSLARHLNTHLPAAESATYEVSHTPFLLPNSCHHRHSSPLGKEIQGCYA